MSAPSEGAYMRCRTPQAGRISRAVPSRRRIHSAFQRSYFVHLTAYHLDALGLDLSPSSAYVFFSRLGSAILTHQCFSWSFLFSLRRLTSSSREAPISTSPGLGSESAIGPRQLNPRPRKARLRSSWAIITLYNVNCRSSSRWLHSSVTLYPTINIERKSTHF
jgi:hypothetical protein